MFTSQRLPWLLAVAAAVAFGFVTGCGDSGSGPARSPVQGEVSYDGEPVDSGGIAFLPDGGDNDIRATGQIRDGRYDLDARRGPFPGKYRVEITWQKKTGKKVPGEAGHPKDETLQIIPPKYYEESELTVTVQPGRNTLDFHLKK